MSSAKRALTPEDVLNFKNVEDAQISPDGTQVAFVIGDSFKAESKWPKSTIWLVATAGGEPRPLTNGPRTDSLPRWSPDGSRLAFLSDRLAEGQRQLFVIARDGGEALPLTDIGGEIPTPRGLNALQWSPDGRALAFLQADPETDDERRRIGRQAIHIRWLLGSDRTSMDDEEQKPMAHGLAPMETRRSDRADYFKKPRVPSQWVAWSGQVEICEPATGRRP